MALELSKETVHGIGANYWKVSEIYIDRINARAVVHMLLYKEKAISEAKKAALEVARFEWSGENYPYQDKASEDVVALTYAKIKSLVPGQGELDFRAAVDV